MIRVHLALSDKSGVCRLDHGEQPHREFPFGAGLMTQVSELFPMRIRDPGGPAFIAANMIPLLADALHKMGEQFPETLTLPVWAQLDPELLGFIGLQQAGFRTNGRFGWMATLRGARDLFAAHRRNFFPVVVEDVDSFLPLYREVYGETFSREELERVLDGRS